VFDQEDESPVCPSCPPEVGARREFKDIDYDAEGVPVVIVSEDDIDAPAACAACGAVVGELPERQALDDLIVAKIASDGDEALGTPEARKRFIAKVLDVDGPDLVTNLARLLDNAAGVHDWWGWTLTRDDVRQVYFAHVPDNQ
jgi:hypothetical protein